MKITGAQVRAARAMLRMTAEELAKKAGVSTLTLQAVERAQGESSIAVGLSATRAYRQAARQESVEKIRAALEAAGVTFLKDDGRLGPGIRGQIDQS